MQQTRILSRIAAEDFIGRRAETDELLRHASGEGRTNALFLLSAPACGSSELLRQTYDRLFHEQDSVIPFYFAFSRSDRDARRTAVRFLQTFLRQAVAFRRRDPRLLSIAPDVFELSELAAARDARWIQSLVAMRKNGSFLNDEASFVRTALSAPLRAAAGEAPVFMMLDDLHRAASITGEADFFEELKDVLSGAEIPFVAAGRRRFLHREASRIRESKLLRLGSLADADAVRLVEALAKKLKVEITDASRDLIVRQFGTSPVFITHLLRAAQGLKSGLASYSEVQSVTNEALFAGDFGGFYDSLFDEIIPEPDTQRRVIRILQETADKEFHKATLEAWCERLEKTFAEVYRIARQLHIHEIVRLNGGGVEFQSENTVLSDYVAARFRLEILNEPRALVVSDVLTRALKRAPQIMTHFYRGSSAVNLQNLLAAFNCQSVSRSLFDYGSFKENFREDAGFEDEKMTLPQIVFTSKASAFYPSLMQVDETARAAVALGFEAADYRAGNETVWIAAEVDSKLEASKELAEFWCDRLEMVALMCNFPRYRLWLVTPEGFTEEAVEVLRSRGVYSSNRKQIEILADELKAGKILPEKKAQDEYEMILPMGEDTEIIAAQTVEEIARRQGFKQAAINQIKTALVEACINATEHSHSPDRKIYQRFKVEDDRLVITVMNRGVKIPAEKIAESGAPIEPGKGRRGWGLKLMRTLMDEVNFEQTDEGTRISMVKVKKE